MRGRSQRSWISCALGVWDWGEDVYRGEVLSALSKAQASLGGVRTLGFSDRGAKFSQSRLAGAGTFWVGQKRILRISIFPPDQRPLNTFSNLNHVVNRRD